VNDNVYIERQISFMDNIIKMHYTVKNIHVSLKKLYPITIIKDNYFFVFDINKIGDIYEFKLK
jgi:hypothetical protein